MVLGAMLMAWSAGRERDGAGADAEAPELAEESGEKRTGVWQKAGGGREDLKLAKADFIRERARRKEGWRGEIWPTVLGARWAVSQEGTSFRRVSQQGRAHLT